MSKGPGRLQQRLLGELRKAPFGLLPWRVLKKRFPCEVERRTFYRAVRSLRRMGRILDYEAGGLRYVALTALGDAELLSLCDAAHVQLRAVIAARDLSEPGVATLGKKVLSERVDVGTYQRPGV